MMPDPDSTHPDPIDGTTFEWSVGQSIILIFIGLLFPLFAAVVLGLDNLPPSRVLDTIFAIIMGLSGAGVIGIGVQRVLRRRRAVIGLDRFQLIHKSGGADVVVAQVMFANIIGLGLMKQQGVTIAVLVQLADPNAAGTFDAMKGIRPRDGGRGHQFVIPNQFRKKLDNLRETLDSAVIEWRAEQDEDERPVKKPGGA
jgi:hypothetical protein